MKFRFEFDIKKNPWTVNHLHKLFLIGSCFTENIGEKLMHSKFNVLENPHGILFNPTSVVNAISDYVLQKKYTEDDLFFLNESWHSWNHHSRFSGVTKEDALDKINTSIQRAHHYLKTADYLFITLGSSWVYTLTEKAANTAVGAVAANNHKAPSDWFQRKLLKVDDLLTSLDHTVRQLAAFNPKLKIIFTISPVRHLREGVIENNRSKAVLIQAVHDLIDRYNHLYYFPAYELVIDDLRDYRFYAEDLVHPNYFATQYVWEKFVDASMTEATKKLMEDLHAIQLAYKHKPFNAGSDQHKAFLKSYAAKALEINKQYPHIDLQKEIEYFKS